MVVSLAFQEESVVDVDDGDFFFGEPRFIAVVTKLSDRDERLAFEVGEDVRFPSCFGEVGHV